MSTVSPARPYAHGRPETVAGALQAGVRVESLIDSRQFGVDLRAGDFGTVVDQPTDELVFVRWDGFEMASWMRRDHLEVV